MPNPTYFLLHVADPLLSADVYAGLLAVKPVETSPTFVLFVFDGAIKLGLWKTDTVVPARSGSPGAMEIGFPVATPSDIEEARARAVAAGFTVVQEPTDLDFGRSLTLADPDGHRIRVFMLFAAIQP